MDFWDRIARRGDPARVPNLTEEAFNAGWWKHEALQREAARMLETLTQIWELADPREDIGEDGQPNFAMEIKILAQQAIERATGETL